MELKNVKIFVDHHFITEDLISADAAGMSDRMPVPRRVIDKVLRGSELTLETVESLSALEPFGEGTPRAPQPLADYYARHGVTSYLATTMTLPEEVLTTAMHTIRDFRRQGGAKCAGVHLEGPFLSIGKRGAQAACNLHQPDTAMFHRLNEASGGQVRLVTVACEEPGAMEFIQEISKECTVSLGHTTADYDTAMEAFRRGGTPPPH